MTPEKTEMHHAPHSAPAGIAAVGICTDSPDRDRFASAFLGTAARSGAVELFDFRCDRPAGVASAVGDLGADHLVLAVCDGGAAVGKIQAQARRAGLDPLGVEIISIERSPGDPDRLAVLVGAAVARARAFDGSRPENSRIRASAELSRRAILTLSLPRYDAVPSFSARLCASRIGCAACVDACPVGALSIEGGDVAYDREKCIICGQCVGVCPTGAVINPTITPAQLGGEIRSLLGAEVSGEPSVGIAYECGHSQARPLPEGWYPVRVPCTTMLPAGWILGPLALGAAAVSVTRCSDFDGTDSGDRLSQRLDFCAELLGSFGAPESTLQDSPGALPEISDTEAAEGDAAPAVDRDVFSTTDRGAAVLATAERFGVGPGVAVAGADSPLGSLAFDLDICTKCGTCAMYCPPGALAHTESADAATMTFDPALCTACNGCVPACPEPGAISLERVTDIDSLRLGTREIYREKVSMCESCGAPVASAPMLAKIREMLGEEHSVTADLVSRYCQDCRAVGAR